MKKWTLMIGMLIGALVFGLAAFAAVPLLASAQAAATSTPPAASTNAPAAATNTNAPAAASATPVTSSTEVTGTTTTDPDQDGGFQRPREADALTSAAASVTGLTAQEVTTQLQAGQSLAQIATAKGKTADDVIAAARTALTTQLQAAVTAKTITQAQADAKLAQFNQTATQIVNDTTLGQEGGGHGGGHGGNHGGPDNDSNPAVPAITTAPTTNS